jgi:hypothetical protein
MPTCDTCGNSYDKTFEVVTDDQHYVFDSFECAVHKLAPACGHCGCRIMGHGVEAQGSMFCCANCARGAGKTLLRDRAE